MQQHRRDRSERILRGHHRSVRTRFPASGEEGTTSASREAGLDMAARCHASKASKACKQARADPC